MIRIRKSKGTKLTGPKVHAGWLEAKGDVVYCTTACGESWELGAECITVPGKVTCKRCRLDLLNLLRFDAEDAL